MKKTITELILAFFIAFSGSACSQLNSIKPEESQTQKTTKLEEELFSYTRLENIYSDIFSRGCVNVCKGYQQNKKEESLLWDKKATTVLDNIKEKGIATAVFKENKDSDLFYGVCCRLFVFDAVKSAMNSYIINYLKNKN